jgi:hypothetical protein
MRVVKKHPAIAHVKDGHLRFQSLFIHVSLLASPMGQRQLIGRKGRPVKKSERPTSNSGSNTSHYGNHFRHNHWYHGWGHRQVPHARKGSRWLDYHNLNWFSWLVPRHISRTSSWFISYGRACWFYRVNPWGDYPSFTLPAGGQTTHVIRARCQACLKPLFSTWMGCFAHPVDFHRGRFPRGGPARRKFQSTMPR